MILYIEKAVKDNFVVTNAINKFKKSDIIFIDNYKNIFDKNTWSLNIEKSIIFAKLRSNAVSDAPLWYWHTWNSYFFKTSLNCSFDCSYCYLKWAFKNDMQVFFVNYDDIKKEIKNKIASNKSKEILWFYSSDYSDILASESISNFSIEFISLFEEYDNVMMEIRTKSVNIWSLLKLWFIPKNTEIAFSLNPQELIDLYEFKTPSLDSRIACINELISKWFKVWLRFLPLLPVKNYYNIYLDFTKKIRNEIDLSKINSNFASWLLYTKKDYNKMLRKYPDLDILYMLDLNDDDFYREAKEVRENLYKIFKNLDNKCLLCLEN